ISGYATPGLVYYGGSGVIAGDNELEVSSPVEIPNGSTYYFEVRGDVTLTQGSGTFSGNVTTKLIGDTTYPVPTATLMVDEVVADGTATTDNFIWSPNST